jgi:hypothetical protein
METKAKARTRGERVPLSEIHERGKRLRLRMVTAGYAQYAAQLIAWSPKLAEIEQVQDRIRQIGLGRGHSYDLGLLEEIERIADRRLRNTKHAA